jgi:polar amino acid transport system ATP-binding protein
MICVKNLTLAYQQSGSTRTVLTQLTVTMPRGRITTLVGQSGVGKTSLLRCLAGLEKRYQGSIYIDGYEGTALTPQQRAQLTGFVFQNYNLFPHRTAVANCMQPLMLVGGLSASAAKLKALMHLEALGMAAYTNSYPAQLSGGQQQRIALARALCLEPKVLLLDEPSSALDPDNSERLANILHKLRDTGIAIVVSSQDTAFVAMLNDRVLVIEDGMAREET